MGGKSMMARLMLSALALAGASPAWAEKYDIDYDLKVTSRQQRVDGVLQPIVPLPSAEQRSYSGTLRVNFGAVTETLEDGANFTKKVRVQSVTVSYDLFQLAPDLLPFSPAAGLPAPKVFAQSIFRLERAETNGVPDEGGAYRLSSLAWSSGLDSSTFDVATVTGRSVHRTERIFDFFPVNESFRFASAAPSDLAAGLEAAQYRTCGNFSCAFNGALAWQLYNGDETRAPLLGQESGTANLFLGTLTFSNARLAVPEPSSWVFMIGGFAMVGTGLRTRSRRAHA
jgi:hypothetical protein